MLKYLLAKPKNGPWLDLPQGADAFSYHQESGLRALLSGFLLVAIMEATVLHFLLAIWSHWIAIAATLSTVWLILQIISQIRAVGLRPIYIANNRLVLRNGAFDIAKIDIEQIESIDASAKDVDIEVDQLKPFNVCFPASHNVVLILKSPAQGIVFNRRKRDFQIALLAIDDKEGLVNTLLDKLGTTPSTV